MMTHAVQLLTAFIGSLGFAILFHVPKKHLFSASLGGFFSWGIYLFGVDVGLGRFMSCLFASAFSALYAEILARVKRAPAVLFFIPAVIPLVPGSNLYYTMLGIGTEDWVSAKANAVLTLQYALSIALGISVMWAVLSIARSIREKRNAS